MTGQPAEDLTPLAELAACVANDLIRRRDFSDADLLEGLLIAARLLRRAGLEPKPPVLEVLNRTGQAITPDGEGAFRAH